MRRVAVLGLVLVVMASACGHGGGGATAASSTTAPTTRPTEPTTTTLPNRSIVLVSVTGEVDPAATGGEALGTGSSITTGVDGIAVLETDDGTTIVVLEDSVVAIAGLSWSGGETHTTLSLLSGQVVAVRAIPLPPRRPLRDRGPRVHCGIGWVGCRRRPPGGR